MTYIPTIPASGDKISQSQGQILTNFTQLNTIFDNDHFKFSNATNNGLHRQIQLPVIPSVPSVSGAGGAVYTAVDAGGLTQLFWKNATQTVQITGTTGSFAAAAAGWMTLPGGVKIAWGYDTQAGAGVGQYTINYNGGSGVTFANVFVAYLTTLNTQPLSGSSAMLNNSFPVGGTYNRRGFDQNNIYYFSSSGSIVAVNWFAIGN